MCMNIISCIVVCNNVRIMIRVIVMFFDRLVSIIKLSVVNVKVSERISLNI